MIVRPLTSDDFHAWKKLWKGYHDFYKVNCDSVYDLAWKRMLSGEKGEFIGRVAEAEDGSLAGLVHYLYHRHGWHEEEVCYLQDLYVSPEHRRKGIAEELMHTVFREAKQAGACQVYWMTQDFNETARLLYDKITPVSPFVRYSLSLEDYTG